MTLAERLGVHRNTIPELGENRQNHGSSGPGRGLMLAKEDFLSCARILPWSRPL